MRFVDIIEKKRLGGRLSKEEIEWWIRGYVNDAIPDYQVSALLMAIMFCGMDAQETAELTMAMLHSGATVDLQGIDGIKVDKHSTGGVGDKTTLALGPMLAACGLKVAKMSGRGLGITGGTLDKLESITGFNCFLSQEDFVNQVNNLGIAVIGQTADLVPADKKLYALRDVTGTVASIPLIASSIMSKKLAAGAEIIELDVKYGDGAFMKTPEEAEQLAEAMIRIGTYCKRHVRAMITDMNEPLGNAIGNALEVKEAVDTLRGKGPRDFTELVLAGGASMLTQAGVSVNEVQGRQMMEAVIKDGSALEKLKAMVEAQGGDVRQIEDTERLPKAAYVTEIPSGKSGYVHQAKAMELGRLAMEIGAGRASKEDTIDPAVGIVLAKKVGDPVEAGETLAWVYHNQPLKDVWIQNFCEAYAIDEHPVGEKQLIYKMM